MTITDAEFTNAAARLDSCYQSHLGRPPRQFHVDDLGFARWITDYVTLRQGGSDHESAFVEVERRIHAVAFPPAPVPVPIPGTHPNPLVGRLRIEAGAFVDDTGPVLPVFAHAGNLFALYTRDKVKALDQIRKVASAGYHGVRTWTTLGGPYWEGHQSTVGPLLTPDYQAQWIAFLRDLVAAQLRLVCSQGDPMQTGRTMSERKTFATWLALAARDADGTGHVYAFLDAGNEAWQTDMVDRFYWDGNPDCVANMAAFCKAYKDAGGTALCSTTSPPSEDGADMTRYTPQPPCDVWDVHGDRGGHSWDKRRHEFSLPYEGKPSPKLGIASEPAGNGDLVSASANKHELDHEAVGNLAVMAIISRQAFVWFSGEGVVIRAGLEHEQGFWNVPKAVALLPRDVMRWSPLHHSGDSWASTRVFSLPSEPEVRIDGAISADGRYAYVADGPSGSHRLGAAKGYQGTITDCGTVETHQFSAAQGEARDVSWTRGRLLLGTVV